MSNRSNPHLILASGSPRRRQLLETAGFTFDVIAPEIEEHAGLCSNCGPAELVMQIARQKAAYVVRRLTRGQHPHQPNAVVVACDTAVECGGQILGKPSDEVHARRMLELLSGQECRVFSGLCVWPLRDPKPQIGFETTHLRVDHLDGDRLERYLDSRQWRGKAGGFGYQDGLDWIHVVRGSESNVIGLPLELFTTMLQAVSEAT